MGWTVNMPYGVIAKFDLHTELAKSENSEAFFLLLTLPTCWWIPIGERTNIEGSKQQIKLTFLANLYDLFVSGQEESEIAELIFRLLGNPPFTTDVFDRWWQLVEFQDVYDTDKTASELKVETLKLFRPSGNDSIDRWVDSLISQREDKDH